MRCASEPMPALQYFLLDQSPISGDLGGFLEAADDAGGAAGAGFGRPWFSSAGGEALAPEAHGAAAAAAATLGSACPYAGKPSHRRQNSTTTTISEGVPEEEDEDEDDDDDQSGRQHKRRLNRGIDLQDPMRVEPISPSYVLQQLPEDQAVGEVQTPHAAWRASPTTLDTLASIQVRNTFIEVLDDHERGDVSQGLHVRFGHLRCASEPMGTLHVPPGVALAPVDGVPGSPLSFTTWGPILPTTEEDLPAPSSGGLQAAALEAKQVPGQPLHCKQPGKTLAFDEGVLAREEAVADEGAAPHLGLPLKTLRSRLGGPAAEQASGLSFGTPPALAQACYPNVQVRNTFIEVQEASDLGGSPQLRGRSHSHLRMRSEPMPQLWLGSLGDPLEVEAGDTGLGETGRGAAENEGDALASEDGGGEEGMSSMRLGLPASEEGEDESPAFSPMYHWRAGSFHLRSPSLGSLVHDQAAAAPVDGLGGMTRPEAAAGCAGGGSVRLGPHAPGLLPAAPREDDAQRLLEANVAYWDQAVRAMQHSASPTMVLPGFGRPLALGPVHVGAALAAAAAAAVSGSACSLGPAGMTAGLSPVAGTPGAAFAKLQGTPQVPVRPRGVKAEEAGRPPALCKWFARGTCKFGRDCRYSHDGSGGGDAGRSPSRLGRSEGSGPGLPDEPSPKPGPAVLLPGMLPPGALPPRGGLGPAAFTPTSPQSGKSSATRRGRRSPRRARGSSQAAGEGPGSASPGSPSPASRPSHRRPASKSRCQGQESCRSRGSSAGAARPSAPPGIPRSRSADSEASMDSPTSGGLGFQVVWCDQRAFKDESASLRAQLDGATGVASKAHKTAEKCIRLLQKKRRAREKLPVRPRSVFLVSWANAQPMVQYLLEASHLDAKAVVLCDTCGAKVRDTAQRWSKQFAQVVVGVASSWQEAVAAAAGVIHGLEGAQGDTPCSGVH